MKIIKLIPGKEYVLNDEEFEVFKRLAKQGGLVELSNGDLVNPASIAHAGEPDRILVWKGYPLNKDGRSFQRDGKIVFLEAHNFGEITYEPDPKYLAMKEVKLLKWTKNSRPLAAESLEKETKEPFSKFWFWQLKEIRKTFLVNETKKAKRKQTR